MSISAYGGVTATGLYAVFIPPSPKLWRTGHGCQRLILPLRTKEQGEDVICHFGGTSGLSRPAVFLASQVCRRGFLVAYAAGFRHGTDSANLRRSQIGCRGPETVGIGHEADAHPRIKLYRPNLPISVRFFRVVISEEPTGNTALSIARLASWNTESSSLRLWCYIIETVAGAKLRISARDGRT